MPDYQDSVPLKNAGPTGIPPFGLVASTGTLDPATGSLLVTFPGADSQDALCVNGFGSVGPGETGVGSFRVREKVAYDPEGGEPAPGDDIGSQAGSPYALLGNVGFKVLTAAGGVAEVIRTAVAPPPPPPPPPGPPPSYNCESGNCTDPGDGTGHFTTLDACKAVCPTPVTCDNHTATWNCVSHVCVDPGDGTGTFTDIAACHAACDLDPPSGWKCASHTIAGFDSWLFCEPETTPGVVGEFATYADCVAAHTCYTPHVHIHLECCAEGGCCVSVAASLGRGPDAGDVIDDYSFFPPIDWTIDWGDGSPATSGTTSTSGLGSTPEHTYLGDGTYTVTVSGVDANGVAMSQSRDITVKCDKPPKPGCTDPTAINYDPTATVDDGSCIPHTWNCVSGSCVDPMDGTGTYSTLAACVAACEVKYYCVTITSVSDVGGSGTCNAVGDSQCIGATADQVSGGTLTYSATGPGVDCEYTADVISGPYDDGSCGGGCS